MAIQTLNTIKMWFKTGLKPSQNQFWDTWDSFRHKLKKVPIEDIEELQKTLDAKAEKLELDEHKNDYNAHKQLFDIKEDKSQKGKAGGYVPLDEFSKIASQYLSIVNNLVSGGDTALLSAEQGVALQNQIDDIHTLLSSNNPDLDTIQKIVDSIGQIQLSLDTILVNDLITGGTTKALTAEMGKQLNESKLTGTIAADEETQITTEFTEDNKVVSRLKLFNWWNWIKRLPLTWSNTIYITDFLGQAKSQLSYSGFSMFNSKGDRIFNIDNQGIRFNFNTTGGTNIIENRNSQGDILVLPDKSGTLAITYDSVNTCYGTPTKAPLIIPASTLTTVPQHGAIERDIQGNLYHSVGSVRKKIIDESDAAKFLQTTYRNIKSSNVTNSYSPYNTTMYSYAPSIINAFGSFSTGNYLLKTLDEYIDGYLPIDPESNFPDKVVFEFYLKGMNCKFGGENKIKMYGIERTGATTTNIRSYEIPLIITTASDGTNSWSILSYEENSYDMKGNIIDTTYRSYPLQSYAYTGYNGNGNLKFNEDSALSFDASISFFYEDSMNENGKNAISGSSYTNISTSIIKL